MNGFRFQIVDVRDCSPQEWVRIWADKYQPDDDLEYRELIASSTSFTAQDFERIGKWKDDAKPERRWRPNVASVAYRIWRQAAEELPKPPEKNEAAAFLKNWSRRTYTDVYKNGPVDKRFGLSRATTLLHFVSGGEYPIFDSQVKNSDRSTARPSSADTAGQCSLVLGLVLQALFRTCYPLRSERHAPIGQGALQLWRFERVVFPG